MNERNSRSLAGAPTRLRHVLVPVDFSPESEETLHFAKKLARSSGAKLHLVHVVAPLDLFPSRRTMHPLGYSERGIAVSALERLKKFAAKFSLPARSSLCTVRSGAPAGEINEAARETGADLIAIATRGHAGLERAFLGSTTERVLRGAPCPVLVVPNRSSPGETR